MNFLNIVKNTLNEEKLPQNKTGILLLDIDDTLLKSDSSAIKIYRKLPTDVREIALSSDDYAKENVTPDTKKYYDYRDFRDPSKVYNSIVNGAPILNNLNVVDEFVNGGYKLGILTARGCEDVVAKAIKSFLKVRDANGNLVKANVDRNDIHAVNDDNKHYKGKTDSEKKQNVLRDYANKYDYVYFMDDDLKNLNALKSLKKSDPTISNRLRSIKASKLNEDVLSEMAVKDVDEDLLNRINNGDYETRKQALKDYFLKIKNTTNYVSQPNLIAAYQKYASYGVGKTFAALEKAGKLNSGVTNELKAMVNSADVQNYILDGIDDSDRESLQSETPAKKKYYISKKDREAALTKVSKDDSKVYSKDASGELEKITDRISKYKKLRNTLENFIDSPPSYISDYAVNVRRMNVEFRAATSKKDSSDFLSLETKEDKAISKIKEYVGKFIPPFIVKKVDSAKEDASNGKMNVYVTKQDLADMKKAFGLHKENQEATMAVIYTRAAIKAIDNIIMGFDDIKKVGMDTENTVGALKNDVSFPMDDFIEYEKFIKAGRMERDKKATEYLSKKSRNTANAETDEELSEVRNEYISLANALERAIADGTADQFISQNGGAIESVIYLYDPSNEHSINYTGLDKIEKNYPTETKLLPRLQRIYQKRSEMETNKNAKDDYTKLSVEKSNLKEKREREIAVDKKVSESTKQKYEKLAEKVQEVILDNLGALNTVHSLSGKAILKNDIKKAQKRHEVISKREEEVLRKQKGIYFNKNDEKYNQYYTGDGNKKKYTSKEIYDAYDRIIGVLNDVPFDQLRSKGLISVRITNLPGRKYKPDEIMKLYDILVTEGKDKLIETLQQPEYSTKR